MGLVVTYTRERRLNRFEFGDVASDHFQVGAVEFEDARNDVSEEGFGEVHIAVEVHEGDLGFDHPEFSKVAARLGLLGAEGWAEAVDLAQCQRGGFHIELAGLGEERRVSEVIKLEERAGALAGGGRQDGRVGADEAVSVEILLCRAHDGGPDAQDGGLARCAHPEMAMLHEEVCAMLLGRDGVGCGFGDEVDDFEVLDVELEAGGGARIGADAACDDDGRLLGEGLDALEDLFGDGGLGDDALDGPGAVAEGGEEQLAGRTNVIEPSAQGYGIADVRGERGDGRNFRICNGFCFLFWRIAHGTLLSVKNGYIFCESCAD